MINNFRMKLFQIAHAPSKIAPLASTLCKLDSKTCPQIRTWNMQDILSYIQTLDSTDRLLYKTECIVTWVLLGCDGTDLGCSKTMTDANGSSGPCKPLIKRFQNLWRGAGVKLFSSTSSTAKIKKFENRIEALFKILRLNLRILGVQNSRRWL